MGTPTDQGYQVLARKYRPATFADLIGQEAMVRTLHNAFAADRIAQAFILTGIRGTGKTTTARIIAKGLNCVGTDDRGGPTTDPCGQCANCVDITRGFHVDVMEIDAASNTGVQNVRDTIIETVSYKPAQARYKVFVIDEVHMLSTAAFNALLKTLEEPPAHVKFIFATTEIRKVPVTVLSRCQRFDLRRIEPEVMMAHLARIAEAEGAPVAGDALALITRAAEGSVRDAMSLLDQAISHGAGETTADQVRAMLGLADRGRILDLFDRIMKGEAAAALAELSAQYADGADPVAILRDLAEVTHWLSMVKITPEAADDPTVGPDERARGRAMAEALPRRILARTWQMLLKALEEVSASPNAMMAAEMAVIRLTHVADLPSPDDLVRAMDRQVREGPPGGTGAAAAPTTGPINGPTTGPSPAPSRARGAVSGGAGPQAQPSGPEGGPGAGPQAARARRPDADPEAALAHYATFDQVVALIEANRDIKLAVEVKTSLRLAAYRPGRIEFQPTERAPADLASRLAQKLTLWTGARWVVSVVAEGGGDTIEECETADQRSLQAQAEAHPLMQAVRARFPDATITEIRTREALEAEANGAALEEVPDDWDPFEED